MIVIPRLERWLEALGALAEDRNPSTHRVRSREKGDRGRKNEAALSRVGRMRQG